jgi:triosephosphate isomerase
MNLLQDPARDLAVAVRDALQHANGVEVVLCPPSTALHSVAHAVSGTPIGLGGQNCYLKESGAFTGEVSPQMLLDAGCTWVIIGHSERRQVFGETDELLAQKLDFALRAGLKVMFCIGETLDEHEANNTFKVLERQVTRGLEPIDAGRLENVVLAYEPVWAIGTGRNATPEQAEEAHAFVRELIAKKFGDAAANALRIQYGGSVKPANAAELLGQDNVDGALVGGASLEADSFAAIVNSAVA